MRISPQIALFPSLLIPGRQPTAVGFKIPAPRVAIYDLPDDPLIRIMKITRIRPEMGLTRSPEEESEALLLGTIDTGPWAVGTVIGSVIGGHRGRQGGHRGRRKATAIPNLKVQVSVGKGLIVL